MQNLLLKAYVALQALKNSEEGQDLVEYALLVSLIALVCVSSLSNLANGIDTVFSNISQVLSGSQDNVVGP
jgi:pilus assembly protein Flp/PilA